MSVSQANIRTERESHLLWSVISNPVHLQECASRLKPYHFTLSLAMEIYDEVLFMLNNKKSVNQDTLRYALLSSQNGQAKIAYLTEIAVHFTVMYDIEPTVDSIINDWAIRTTRKLIQDVANGIDKKEIDLSSAMMMIRAIESEIQTGASVQKDFHVSTGLAERVDDLMNGVVLDDDGIITGIEGLDRILKITNGSLVVLGARTSMGKSTLARQIMLANATTPTMFFSYEVSNNELQDQLLPTVAKIDSTIIRNRALVHQSDFVKQAVRNAVQYISTLPFWLEETPHNLTNLVSRMTYAYHQLGVRFFIVDYTQLVPPSKSKGNREQEVAEISRALKQTAKMLNVPIIALSQVSRSCESRTNKRPFLSDLRESGSVEQDANAVIFIYRDEVYNPNGMDDEGRSNNRMAEIIVAKNRGGALGTVRTIFFKEEGYFEEEATEYSPPAPSPQTTSDPSPRYVTNHYVEDSLPF